MWSFSISLRDFLRLCSLRFGVLLQESLCLWDFFENRPKTHTAEVHRTRFKLFLSEATKRNSPPCARHHLICWVSSPGAHVDVPKLALQNSKTKRRRKKPTLNLNYFLKKTLTSCIICKFVYGGLLQLAPHLSNSAIVASF